MEYFYSALYQSFRFVGKFIKIETFTLAGLKLLGLLDLAWGWVFMPIWATFLILGLVFSVFALGDMLVRRIS